jgi:hypothetical protein
MLYVFVVARFITEEARTIFPAPTSALANAWAAVAAAMTNHKPVVEPPTGNPYNEPA